MLKDNRRDQPWITWTPVSRIPPYIQGRRSLFPRHSFPEVSPSPYGVSLQFQISNVTVCYQRRQSQTSFNVNGLDSSGFGKIMTRLFFCVSRNSDLLQCCCPSVSSIAAPPPRRNVTRREGNGTHT